VECDSRRTILVVDDEDVVLRTAQLGLQRRGYRVITACNGREAVQIFEKRSAEISLVLLDMTMPVMSGEATLRELQSICVGVPVLGSSGYDEKEALRRFGAGLAGFLQKPYTIQRLCDKIVETSHATIK
jgi:two-component system cell cycle sensor histidine kinase/response regulator CckA